MTDEMRQALEALAQRFDVPPSKLVMDVYTVCRWMQLNKKHYNLHVRHIEGQNLPTYWMDETAILTPFDEIVYYSEERRKSDFHGWGIKKNPMTIHKEHGETWAWERTWAARFADVYEGAKHLHEHITKIEAERPKRMAGTEGFAEWTTMEVVHARAVADLLSAWVRQLMFDGKIYRWVANVFARQSVLLDAELDYRALGMSLDEAMNKKKHAQLQAEYRKVHELKNMQVFSRAYQEMVLQAPFPDLTIDEEQLPKPMPDRRLVSRMNQSELMAEFVRWVSANEIDPDSFEAEDAHVLKQAVFNAVEQALEAKRAALARAKGQKATSPLPLSKGEGNETEGDGDATN